MTFAQIFKKFPVVFFFGTRRLITVFTKSYHWTLSLACLNHSSSSYNIPSKLISILSFYPGREPDQSPQSSVEVDNAWSCTSTPQYASMEWCSVKKKRRDNFTFTFIILLLPAPLSPKGLFYPSCTTTTVLYALFHFLVLNVPPIF
jgi:hypothetical protein